MIIEKKILPTDFEKILSGKKKFELRLADWECNEGDVLILKEWGSETKSYTGRTLEKKVQYILKTKDQPHFPKEDVEKYGFQIIGFE